MKISKISINNFRLLENVELSLEKKTTVIVGRNNSGKTSLTELFRRLLSDKSPSFVLEDFSLSCHEQFWEAYDVFQAGQDERDVRETLPVQARHATSRNSGTPVTLIRSPTQRMGYALNALRP